MIESLELKFGNNPDSALLQFEPGPVTVFIGPNNSGKSLLLRELAQFLNPSRLSYGTPQKATKVLKHLSIKRPGSAQALRTELMALGSSEDQERLFLPLRLENNYQSGSSFSRDHQQAIELRTFEPTIFMTTGPKHA